MSTEYGVGSTVMHALAAYDEWQGTGDEPEYNEFEKAMEKLRAAVARLVDERVIERA